MEWIYLIGGLSLGILGYKTGRSDGIDLGIARCLGLLEKHKMINIGDPKFDKIFGSKAK